MHHDHTFLRPARYTAAVVGAGLLLAACGSGGDADDTTSEAAVQTTAAESVTITDAWVLATEEDMSAVFGILENASDTEAHLVAAESDLAMMELHEVVEGESGEMVMQPVPGGFTIPAEGSHELTPGADHLMLMGLTAPIVAGDEVVVTLQFEDGSAMEFTAVAKDFEGGDEEYQPGMDGM